MLGLVFLFNFHLLVFFGISWVLSGIVSLFLDANYIPFEVEQGVLFLSFKGKGNGILFYDGKTSQ